MRPIPCARVPCVHGAPEAIGLDERNNQKQVEQPLHDGDVCMDNALSMVGARRRCFRAACGKSAAETVRGHCCLRESENGKDVVSIDNNW